MEVHRLSDPRAFLELASPLLEADEARHNLIFGICSTLEERPDAYPEFHLWVALDHGRAVGAALMTEPFNVVVAKPTAPTVLSRLASAIGQQGVSPPGATGAVPEITDFAAAWKEQTGDEPHLEMEQRIYSLTSVRPVTGVDGRMRWATEEDGPLVKMWFMEFSDEALPRRERHELDARTERMIELRLQGSSGRFAIWEDEGPASVAGYSGRTPNGVRIGPVYTPPELRRSGYATALVAALSQHLLLSGHRFCFLYTDLSNRTSNSIYQQVGYVPVCDSAMYRFEGRP